MSHHRKLCLLCVRGISTYDPNCRGIDEHIETFVLSEDCKTLDDSDCTFVSEVLAGCIRFEKLIKVIVDGFYARDGRTCLKADYNIFKVIGYLVMFRMEELGMSHFRRFVMSQDTVKMHKFLNFVFDELNLRTWIQDEWCKVYDHSFVQTNVLSPMMRYHPEMLELIQQLKDKVENREKPKRDSKKATESKPFNLTQPRPRIVPTPEKIPLLKVYKPVPKTTYVGPSEKDALEKLRETAKRRAEERAYEAEKMKFSCANTEKSEKTKAVIQQILKEREEKEVYEPLKVASVPSNIHESVPIKMNMAAILREGARVHKEEDALLKRLAGLEAGEKDDSDFLRWQEEVKQKEAAEAMAEIERKHLAGQLSYEEAIIAKQAYHQENKEKVKVIKEESEQIMSAYFREQEEQRKEMRKLVETIAEGRENVKEAKDKLQKMKQSIVQQVAKESRVLMRQALEEAEEEMRKKVDLIKQIRAIESVPIIRHKLVDLTETSGHGLLSEMSIAELHERLSLAKLAYQEEEEQRRKEIAANKEAKERLLTDTMATISRHRSQKVKQTEDSKIQRKASMAKLLADQRDKKVLGLQEQLEAKRKERQRMQQDIARSRAKAKMGSDKNSTSNWSDLKKSRSAAQLASGDITHSSALSTLLRSSAHT